MSIDIESIFITTCLHISRYCFSATMTEFLKRQHNPLGLETLKSTRTIMAKIIGSFPITSAEISGSSLIKEITFPTCQKGKSAVKSCLFLDQVVPQREINGIICLSGPKETSHIMIQQQSDEGI